LIILIKGGLGGVAKPATIRKKVITSNQFLTHII